MSQNPVATLELDETLPLETYKMQAGHFLTGCTRNYVLFGGIPVYDEEHALLQDGFVTRAGYVCSADDKERHWMLVLERNSNSLAVRRSIKDARTHREVYRIADRYVRLQ